MKDDWVVSFTKRSALKWNRVMTWHEWPSSSQSKMKLKKLQQLAISFGMLKR